MQPTSQQYTYDQLHALVKDNKITAITTEENKRIRLFVGTNGLLCYFPPRRTRSGFKVSDQMLQSIKAVHGPNDAPEKDPKDALWNKISKYRKMAGKASFSNKFIQDCLALPASRSEWEQNGSKGLYELGITTGNCIDGKVISLARIEQVRPYDVQAFRHALANKTEYSGSRFPFANYEATLGIHVSKEGEAMGTLSVEFKGCGNGYYYLLINDENFIGYDVD